MPALRLPNKPFLRTEKCKSRRTTQPRTWRAIGLRLNGTEPGEHLPFAAAEEADLRLIRN